MSASLLVVLAGAGCAVQESPGATDAGVRNVAIVCIDTLRADHVGCYGYARPTTPSIDAAARAGVRFERATAHSPWTLPATASLLTSLYPHEHGAVVEGDVKRLATTTPNQLRDEVPTLAGVLRTGGFRTALFAANPYLGGGLERGFDVAVVKWEPASVIIDQAIEWLRDLGDDRFFVYIHLMDLHQPNDPPAPYYDLFDAPAGGPRGPEHGDWLFGDAEDLESLAFRRFRDHRIGVYDGSLRYVDAEIGRLLAVLPEDRVLDDTLLVVTSDHGEEFWDHAETERVLGGDPRGLWGIGHGHSMFEELLRVPLVFRGPGVAGGRVIEHTVTHADVAPTVLAATGVPTPGHMRGRSLLHLLATAGEGGGWDAKPALAESPAYGPDSRALTWNEWKLISRLDGVELLFDLRSDPEERKNLIEDEREVAQTLRDLMDAEVRAQLDFGRSSPLELDDSALVNLQTLGYLP